MVLRVRPFPDLSHGSLDLSRPSQSLPAVSPVERPKQSQESPRIFVRESRSSRAIHGFLVSGRGVSYLHTRLLCHCDPPFPTSSYPSPIFPHFFIPFPTCSYISMFSYILLPFFQRLEKVGRGESWRGSGKKGDSSRIF